MLLMLKCSSTLLGAKARSFPVSGSSPWDQVLFPSPGAMGLLTPKALLPLRAGWMDAMLGDGKAPKHCSPFSLKPQSPVSHTNQPSQPAHPQTRGAFILSVITDRLSQCSRCLQPLGDRTRQKAAEEMHLLHGLHNHAALLIPSSLLLHP